MRVNNLNDVTTIKKQQLNNHHLSLLVLQMQEWVFKRRHHKEVHRKVREQLHLVRGVPVDYQQSGLIELQYKVRNQKRDKMGLNLVIYPNVKCSEGSPPPYY